MKRVFDSSTCLASPSPKPYMVVPTIIALIAALHKRSSTKLTFLCLISQPYLKGDSLSIKISEDVYQSCLANCNSYLHGRLVLSRGDKPLSSKDLREKLLRLWKPIDQRKMIPLGRGFIELCFSYADDLISIWSNGAWNLKPGLLL